MGKPGGFIGSLWRGCSSFPSFFFQSFFFFFPLILLLGVGDAKIHP